MELEKRGDMMRDIDVRKALHKNVRSYYPHDSDTLVIDELAVCEGRARIDVAVINGSIHGYEIKSEKDTLERLPSQINYYNKVLETVTIVTSNKHISQVRRMVPKWWGIIVAETIDGNTILRNIRNSQKNPNIDPFSLVQLLWHEEAKKVLEEYSLASGIKRSTRKYVWNMLATEIPTSQLIISVRNTLKKRDTLKERNIF